MIEIKRHLYVTVDDLPLTAGVAGLDKLNRTVRGVRGYGGPVAGHWIKLTNARKSEKLALVNYIEVFRAEYAKL